MNEQEAKRLETRTEWNGKANVCTHCRRVPEIFYVATGHDHTDYDIKWCPCREVKQTDEIAELRSANAELKRQLEEAKSESRDACIGLNDYFGKQLAESQAREARLLAAIDAHVNPCGCFDGCEFCNGKTTLEEAIALPHDDTALNEYRDAVIDDCIATAMVAGVDGAFNIADDLSEMKSKPKM